MTGNLKRRLAKLERELSKPEPPQTPNNNPAVWDLVYADMQAREKFGREKCGMTLQPFNGRDYPMLIEKTRELLAATGKPYVIENVEGAPLVNPLLLCGEMFGLRTYRHRLFESSIPLPFLMHRPHGLRTSNLHGKPTGRTHMVTIAGKARYAGALEDWREAMQINWMTERGLSQAIPPAYTQFIGEQLMAYMEVST